MLGPYETSPQVVGAFRWWAAFSLPTVSLEQAQDPLAKEMPSCYTNK